jgi:hypothetical protein
MYPTYLGGTIMKIEEIYHVERRDDGSWHVLAINSKIKVV